MRMKELLAPAGNYESLVAAVQGGANAVYLSGKSFGARKYADNFDLGGIDEAVAYCHIRDVKVYVTVNTLIKNEELQAVINYIGELYALDVDAVIVQDIGLVQLIGQHYPDFECHASTQMTLHNVDDVRVAQEMGLKRVVLARELSVEEIQHVIKETGVEVEAFVHGALCVSYSGQCLMSSMIGGRSGNRGRCAQACRKNYQLVTFEDMRSERESIDSGYLLSPKDLCTVTDFEKIMATDIYSYKIEGRMKGPEYTYQVVSTYRALIDEALDNNGQLSKISIDTAMEKLEKVFNRDFTKGLLLGDSIDNRMSMDTPSNKGYAIGEVIGFDSKRQQLKMKLEREISVGDDLQIRRSNKTIGGRVEHVFIGGAKEKFGAPGEEVRIPFKYNAYPGEVIYKTFDKVLASEIHQWLDKERLKKPVHMVIRLTEGQPVSLEVTDNRDNKVSVMGERLVEKALKIALTEERIVEQLSKIGDTPYHLESYEIHLADDVTVPVKELNLMRREALMELSDLREVFYAERKEQTTKVKLNDLVMSLEELDIDELKYPLELRCSVATLEQLEAVIASGIKTIYYKDIKTVESAYDRCKESEIAFSFHGNKILHDRDLQSVLAWLETHEDAGLVTGHIGGVQQVSKRRVAGDYSLNVMNIETAKFYKEQGLESIYLSPELTSEELKVFQGSHAKKEVLLFGRQGVMTMNYCPVKACDQCKSMSDCQISHYGLVDEKKVFFPLFATDCRHVQVLNGPYVNLVDEISRLEHMGISLFRLEFYNEDRAFVNGALTMVKKAMEKDSSYKNDEEWLKTTYDISYTNGHLRRGVQ